MRRSLLIGLIVLFWLTMVGWLVLRENRGPRRAVPVTQVPSEMWLAISVEEGPRIGTLRVAQEPETRDGEAGARLELKTRLRLEILDQPTDLALDGEVWRREDGSAAVFDFTVASGGQEVGVSGRFADGLLRAELASGDGAPTEVEIPIDDPLAFASGSLGNLVALPTCEPGERYRLDAFDPLTLQASEARVTCGERETITVAGVDREAQQVRLETGGVETEAWLDEAGMMLRARTPFGLVLEALDMDPTLASDESTAIDGSTAGDGRAAAGLLARTAVKPSGERPFRGASRIVLSASGVERPLPVDDHQRVTANGFTLVHGVPGGGCAPRPEHLAAEPFVESDHPRIQEQARQIVGDATERSEQARLLYEWVWGTLEKTPVLGLPSAIEVLDDGRGDCNEHTVLYTALARAVELPTRIAVGLVWSDDLDGFYYHAWPEVCVEAGWQRMDPTLGQEIADATHIKILEGGIARWPQLVPYIGRLAIEIDAIE